MPARGGGDLIGRKPLAFCAWLFEALGMLPGDELVDLFPGTGIVGRAWAELSRSAERDGTSMQYLDDESSSLQEGDASLLEHGDAFARSVDDTSSPARDDE